MADLYDQAQDTDALLVASALAVQKTKAAAEPKLAATGECLNPLCGEPLPGPQLFCGASCAKEHARRSK